MMVEQNTIITTQLLQYSYGQIAVHSHKVQYCLVKIVIQLLSNCYPLPKIEQLQSQKYKF